MVLVTEPVFGSLHNITTAFRDVPSAPEAAAAAKLSPLEVKYGLAHLAEALQFLHADARLAHSNVNPGTVILTKDGSWKLAGFAFVGSAEGFGSGGGGGGGALVFDYHGAGGGMALWDEVQQVRGTARGGGGRVGRQAAPWLGSCGKHGACKGCGGSSQAPVTLVPAPRPALSHPPRQPPLAYTAPELVAGSGAAPASDAARIPSAADVFSLGVIAHGLLAERAPLPPGCSLGEYKARYLAMGGADAAGAPPQLQVRAARRRA